MQPYPCPLAYRHSLLHVVYTWFTRGLVYRLARSNLVSLFRAATQDVPKTDPVAARRAILDPEELAVRHSNIVR